MGRYEVEADAVEFGGLPPVQLGDPAEPPPPEPAADSGGHEDRGVARESRQGGGVEVVVVVVADDDRVHAGQCLPGEAHGGDPGRGAEDPAGPDGVGEDGEPADAHHPTRVPRPGDGDGPRAHPGQRAGLVRQSRDVGEPVGPRPDRALAGEPGEGLQAGQGRGQPVGEGPGPAAPLVERAGLRERRGCQGRAKTDLDGAMDAGPPVSSGVVVGGVAEVVDSDCCVIEEAPIAERRHEGSSSVRVAGGRWRSLKVAGGR